MSTAATSTIPATDRRNPFPPSSPIPPLTGAGRVGASLVFAKRAVLKVRHVPEQSLDVLAIPIVFTVMFTYLFGGALAGSTADYLRYLLPGTLVMSMLLLTMYTGVALATDRSTGTLDRFRAMPTWRPAPIVGAMVGDLARYLIAAGLVLSLGAALGFRPDSVGAVAASIGLILAFCSALSWVWAAIGLVVRTPTAVMNLGLVVLFPLTLASNVFVDPTTTPRWMQSLIRINPVSHVVTAARELMLDAPAGADVLRTLLATVSVIAIFAPLTAHLYTAQR
jgi:ABC-2 type transport system permease protein